MNPTTKAKSSDRKNLNVAIIYAQNDRADAQKIYRTLTGLGFNVWIDTKNILPGQNLELQITNMIHHTDVIIFCISRNITGDNGYIHNELLFVLDEAAKRPEDSIFVIPVRLENCPIPVRLSHLHYVDINNEDGYMNLTAALDSQVKPKDENKKEQTTWRSWGDHPIIVTIATLSSIIAIMVFITGRNNIADLFKRPTGPETSDTINLYWEIAMDSYKKGDYQRTFNEASNILKLDPDNAPALALQEAASETMKSVAAAETTIAINSSTPRSEQQPTLTATKTPIATTTPSLPLQTKISACINSASKEERLQCEAVEAEYEKVKKQIDDNVQKAFDAFG